LGEDGRPKLAVKSKKKPAVATCKLTLFAPPEHPVVDQLRQLDLNSLTPLEALRQLAELQSQVEAGAAKKPR